MNTKYFVEFIDILGRKGEYGYFANESKLISDFEYIIKEQDVISVFIDGEFCNINSKYIVSYRIEKGKY
ncbi:hypothetical protein ACRTAL_002335 [Clostridium perfringens]